MDGVGLVVLACHIRMPRIESHPECQSSFLLAHTLGGSKWFQVLASAPPTIHIESLTTGIDLAVAGIQRVNRQIQKLTTDNLMGYSKGQYKKNNDSKLLKCQPS